jgi:tRNA(Ile2)-agmatinylcytidine synthase
VRLNIGIDDTDSIKGGCTTYVAALLVEQLSQMEVCFTDYPNIIRLNPNIPYKTRGNAAVALRLDIPTEAYNVVQESVLRLVEENSQLGEKGTDPAVVLVKGRPATKIRRFSRKALTNMIPLREAVWTLKSSGGSAFSYGDGLGLVGALAAVGETLTADHTYELIAYRTPLNRGKLRLVEKDSVIRMDRTTRPGTFNSYDCDNDRVLITPHGPDPVLLGVRGESPEDVVKAFSLLRIREPIERWVIFRTNQGTEAHLENTEFVGSMHDNIPVRLRGTVLDKPNRIRGGHVFFTIKHAPRTTRCAAFEPTGKFKEVVAQLVPGDEVTVFGGVRTHGGKHPITVNLEKLIVGRLNNEARLENPICPLCGKHMKSAGRNQGFRCRRCDFLAPDASKHMQRKGRTLLPGLYVPDRKAQRHLTKPLSRYGFEKRRWKGDPPLGTWHRP